MRDVLRLSLLIALLLVPLLAYTNTDATSWGLSFSDDQGNSVELSTVLAGSDFQVLNFY